MGRIITASLLFCMKILLPVFEIYVNQGVYPTQFNIKKGKKGYVWHQIFQNYTRFSCAQSLPLHYEIVEFYYITRYDFYLKGHIPYLGSIPHYIPFLINEINSNEYRKLFLLYFALLLNYLLFSKTILLFLFHCERTEIFHGWI